MNPDDAALAAQPGRPRRPLFAWTAAVVFASALGSARVAGPLGTPAGRGGAGLEGLLPGTEVWRLALCASLAAWLAGLAARPARTRVARTLLCATIACAAGLRASTWVDERLARGLEPSATFDRADEAREFGRAFAGKWKPVPDARGERAVVDGRAFRAPRGAIEAGEEILLLPTEEARRPATGPEPSPRSTSRRTATVELAPDEIVRLSRSSGGATERWNALWSGARAELVARAGALGDVETRALVAALLFGDTSALPEGLPDLFMRTGTYHVLAVSGMQVVLVLAFLVLPLARVVAWCLSAVTGHRPRGAREILALLALVAFVPVAGGGAPVVRSALGAAFALIARRLPRRRAAEVGVPGRVQRVHLARRVDAASCLALALAIECTVSPDAPWSLSVQLSYAATAGLVVGTGPVLGAWHRWFAPWSRSARVTSLGRERPAWVWIPLERAARALVGAIAASVAAVAATLPFTWSTLGEWSPVGILATPLIVPPMTALLAGGWLHVLAPGLVPECCLVPLARAMRVSMQMCDTLPGTPEPLPPRPFLLVAVAVVAGFVVVAHGSHAPRDQNGHGETNAATRRRAWALRVALLATALLVVPWRATPARVQFHVLDVGAGTAVVIDGPGVGTWVFDAGSRDRGDVAREALAPLLARLEPGRVGVVLSHEDRDHDEALDWLVERYEVPVFAGARPARIEARLARSVARLDVAPGRAPLPALLGPIAGVDMALERGLADAARGDNEGSRCLRVTAGGETALLCGDAEGAGLEAWIRAFGRGRGGRDGAPDRDRPGGGVRYLLWPHHGSETDYLAPFLAATDPLEVWISAAPGPPVVVELTRRGIVTKCTADVGPWSATLPVGAIPSEDGAP